MGGLISLGPSQIRAIAQFIADVFGVPVSPTAVTGAAFNITSTGVVSITQPGPTVASDPTTALGIATKQYVDATAQAAFSNITVFTSGSGNFTVPAGIARLSVACTGGGGAGSGNDHSNAGSGGGAAGTAIKVLTVTPAQVIAYSVGAAGVGNVVGAGGYGGDSTFSTLTGHGGVGGGNSGPGSVPGGSGSAATGGDVNLTGGDGEDGSSTNTNRGGGGGDSYWGGGGRAGAGGGAIGKAYGAGGGGGYNTLNCGGGNGAGGIIVIRY